jgi:hypothetical protein
VVAAKVDIDNAEEEEDKDVRFNEVHDVAFCKYISF